MTIRTSLLAASLAAGWLSPVAFAAQLQGHQPAPGQSQMSAESAQCARAQPVVARTVDAAMARLETARQANSPSQLRAAIEDLQGALRDVRAQLAPCAAMQQAAGAPAGVAMPGMQQMPSAIPGTPAVAPGLPMDHARMQMGTTPAAKPATGGKPAPPAPMDHSKMQMGKDSAAKPDGASAPATDPVCGLKVDPATTPQATYRGRTYFFCSVQHQQLFQKNPAKYLPKGR